MMLAAGRSAPISPARRPAGEVVRALLAEAEQVIRQRLAPLVGATVG